MSASASSSLQAATTFLLAQLPELIAVWWLEKANFVQHNRSVALLHVHAAHSACSSSKFQAASSVGADLRLPLAAAGA